MKSGELEKASITIAGKEFPLKLNKEEKSSLRSIESEINKKIDQYQSQFANMSLKDSIIMVLISYAFESKSSNKAEDSKHIEQTLSQIESALGSVE